MYISLLVWDDNDWTTKKKSRRNRIVEKRQVTENENGEFKNRVINQKKGKIKIKVLAEKNSVEIWKWCEIWYSDLLSLLEVRSSLCWYLLRGKSGSNPRLAYSIGDLKSQKADSKLH